MKRIYLQTKLISMIMVLVLPLQGQWSNINLLNGRERMGVAVSGNKIFFAGGANSASVSDKVEIYDIETKQWTTTKLSCARMLPAGISVQGKVIFAGGFTPDPIAKVDIYNTRTATWLTSALSVPRFAIATASYEDKALFAGGADLISYKVFSRVDIYKVTTNTWSVDSLSVARAAIGYASVGSKAYFGGGYMLNGKCSNRMDIYDFKTGKWEIDSLPLARGFLSASAVNNKIIFAGGMTEQETTTDRVDIYDTATKTWSTANLSVPRAFLFNNSASVCNKAIFAGGTVINFNDETFTGEYDIVDIYDEPSDTWSVQKLSHALEANAVASLGNKFFSAGGYNKNGLLTTVDIYNCSGRNWTETKLSQNKEHMAYAVTGSKVYFAGGFAVKEDKTGQFSSDKVEIYDTKTGRWTFEKLSKGRDWLEGESAGGKVIFAGGWDEYGDLHTTVDIFDTLTQKWTINQLSMPRLIVSTVKSGNQIMFAGGNGSGGSKSRIDIYNVDSGLWSTEELSEPRFGVASASIGNLVMFAGGVNWTGESGSEKFTDVIDIYNVETKEWTKSKLSIPRLFAAAVTIDDKIIFAGGEGMNGPVNRVDIYNHVTGVWTIDSISTARAFEDNDQSVAVVCDKAYFVGGMYRTANEYKVDFNIIDIYDPKNNTWETDCLPYNLFGHSVAGVKNTLIIAGGESIHPLGMDIHNEVWMYECLSTETEDPGPFVHQIKIFPNPASGQFTIETSLDLNLADAVMGVYDLYGRLVMSKKGVEILGAQDISSLTNGIYIIELKENGREFRSKLLITK